METQDDGTFFQLDKLDSDSTHKPANLAITPTANAFNGSRFVACWFCVQSIAQVSLPSSPLMTCTEPPSRTRPNPLEHGSMIAVFPYKVLVPFASRESRGGWLIGLFW